MASGADSTRLWNLAAIWAFSSSAATRSVMSMHVPRIRTGIESDPITTSPLVSRWRTSPLGLTMRSMTCQGSTAAVGLLVQGRDPLPVVGMDQREEALVGGVEGLRLVAVDPEQLVGPAVGVGGDVPVVVAHVRQLLRVVDAGREVVEGLLGHGALGRGVNLAQGELEHRVGFRVVVGPGQQQQARVSRQSVHVDLAMPCSRHESGTGAGSGWSPSVGRSTRSATGSSRPARAETRRGPESSVGPVALTTSAASAPAISRSVGSAATRTSPGSRAAATASASPRSCPIWAVVSMRPLSGGRRCGSVQRNPGGLPGCLCSDSTSVARGVRYKRQTTLCVAESGLDRPSRDARNGCLVRLLCSIVGGCPDARGLSPESRSHHHVRPLD